MTDWFLKLIRLRRRVSQYKRTFKVKGGGIYFVQNDRDENGIDGRCTLLTDPECHVSEQFRSIRTQLLFILSNKPVKTIMVTSAHRAEGKTVTSCNLAIALAQDKTKKVMLVDTDLRKSSVHHIFNIPRKPGLAEILADNYSVSNFTAKPAVDDLYIIPAGIHSANPSELIGSPKMKELIAALKKDFDYVIFDASPTIPVTDASILSGITDGFILVVRAQYVIAIDLERALFMLENSGAHPLGIIMTFTIEPLSSFLYRYKYRYYKEGEDRG